MDKIDQLYAANGMQTPKDAAKENLTELVETIHVPATPFTIVGTPETGYFIALGKYRLTKNDSLRQCQLLIDKRDYELLFAMIGVAIAERHNVEIIQHDATNTI